MESQDDGRGRRGAEATAADGWPWLIIVAVVSMAVMLIAGAIGPLRAGVAHLVARSGSGAEVCAGVDTILQPEAPAERLGLHLPSTVLLPLETVPADGVETHHLDLAAAANGGTDVVERRQHLVAAGFLTEVRRVWTENAEVVLQNAIADFESPEGARRFHNWATRNTCQYAREVFEVPSVPNAIGFANDYGTRSEPSRTGVQITFLVGSQRHYVLALYDRVPGDHDEVVRLAEMAHARAVP